MQSSEMAAQSSISQVNNVIDVCDPRLLETEPLVSIHMLAYQHGRFLAQAIEGVLGQKTPFAIELIIAEDCSPDDTLNIALSAQRRNPGLVRVVHSRRNVGMHGNSGQSMPFCRGKYVAFCEGDDYWHDASKLADQIALMEGDPEMVLCHTDFDRLTRFRRKRSVHRGNPAIRPARGHAYHDLLQTWSVMTATSIYRRDVLEAFAKSPFYSTRWPFGDLNLLLYASLQGAIGYIDRSTATFRRTRGSAGNSGNAAHLRMSLATEECIEQFLSAYPAPAPVSHTARAILKRRILNFAFLASDSQLVASCGAWLRENGLVVPLLGRDPIAALVEYPAVIRVLRTIKERLDLALSSR